VSGGIVAGPRAGPARCDPRVDRTRRRVTVAPDKWSLSTEPGLQVHSLPFLHAPRLSRAGGFPFTRPADPAITRPSRSPAKSPAGARSRGFEDIRRAGRCRHVPADCRLQAWIAVSIDQHRHAAADVELPGVARAVGATGRAGRTCIGGRRMTGRHAGESRGGRWRTAGGLVTSRLSPTATSPRPTSDRGHRNSGRRVSTGSRRSGSRRESRCRPPRSLVATVRIRPRHRPMSSSGRALSSDSDPNSPRFRLTAPVVRIQSLLPPAIHHSHR